MVLDISPNSSYVSKIAEYKLVSNIASSLWQRGLTCDVLRQDVDNAGYDLIIEANGIIRHIQVKTSYENAKAAVQKVHLNLQHKPCACVIWIIYDRTTLDILSYRLFSNGRDALNLSGFRTAKHTKGNRDGVKAARPNIVEVPKSRFKAISSTDILAEELFG
jgi:hypothetical protein